jgi:hypothetical protein
MFIPIWAIHVIVTLIFVGGLCWACNPSGDYDFGFLFKIPFVIICYLAYWLIMK